MTTHQGESTSIWQDSCVMPTFTDLKEDITTDVCIIGGGIAGLTTAYLLMKEGKKVCLLEAYGLGSGQSGKTTAHFSTILDNRFFELESVHGTDKLKHIINAHNSAIRQVKEIIKSENIDCEQNEVSCYLFSKDDKRSDVLEKEYECSHKAGFIEAQFLPENPFSNFNTGPCLHLPKQLQLHPLKYMNALANKIIEGGGQIYTNTPVEEVFGGKGAFVKTKDKRLIECKSIVVATNSPINDVVAIHTKQAAYRTYVVGFKILKNSFPDILLYDTLTPYHYVRVEHLDSETDILLVGGEDHKTGQEDHPTERYDRLESWARAQFSFIGDVAYKWSGQVMESVDGIGFLGRNPMDDDNVYVITGDCGSGMTHSTIGAMLITDQIMERENPWEKTFSPSRISIMATGKFLKENLNVAAQYIDWLDPKFESNLENLEPEEGMVFRKSGKIMAVYKDNNGSIEYMSAVCPHLAGIVAWNSAEKSWDCPCHGSRFDCHGTVIEGPAVSNLKTERDNLSLKNEEERNFQESDFTDTL